MEEQVREHPHTEETGDVLRRGLEAAPAEHLRGQVLVQKLLLGQRQVHEPLLGHRRGVVHLLGEAETVGERLHGGRILLEHLALDHGMIQSKSRLLVYGTLLLQG